MRRVVITGVGVVSPAGIGKEEFWKSMTEGKSCVRGITRFDASELSSRIAGEVDNFDPTKYFNNPKDLRRTDISTQFALAASKMAVADAGIDISKEDPFRVGISIGIAVGGVDFLEQQIAIAHKKGITAISPYTSIAFFCCGPVGIISIEYGTKGSNISPSTGCTAGHVAIGVALNDIRDGRSDIVFAGGTESPVTPLVIQSFCAINALSKRNDEPEKASRPFDKERDGFVMAEGCGIILLEELNHALKRNAHIYAELAGYGCTCNAYHMTAPSPDPEAHANAMRLALKDASLKPEDVNVVNAHGSSTPLNERAETLAIKKALGDHAYKISVTSIKSMIGHALGGAGGMQAVASALTIEEGIIPPTINYEHPDPDCDLDCTPNEARKADVDVVLTNGCGFSGVNATLAMKKFKE